MIEVSVEASASGDLAIVGRANGVDYGCRPQFQQLSDGRLRLTAFVPESEVAAIERQA